MRIHFFIIYLHLTPLVREHDLKHKQNFVLGLLFTVNVTVWYANVQLTLQKILPSRTAMSALFCNVLAGCVFLLRVTEVLLVGTAPRHL